GLGPQAAGASTDARWPGGPAEPGRVGARSCLSPDLSLPLLQGEARWGCGSPDVSYPRNAAALTCCRATKFSFHKILAPILDARAHTRPIPAITRPRRRAGRGDRGRGAPFQWGWKLGSRACNNGTA